MHICFITSEFPKKGFPHGGVGTFVATLGKALVKKGIEVSVIGLNYTEEEYVEKVDGISVYRVFSRKAKGLQWYLNSKAIATKIKAIHQIKPFDFVETAELGLAFLPKIKGIQYVIRLHGGHHFFAEAENRGINSWKGFQEKRSFKKADAFIAVSNYVKMHTANYLSYRNTAVEVIFNPINSSLFQPQEIALETNNITFAGTICEKKGVRQLIQAFPFVKEKFPKAILNLYGRDWLFPDGGSYMKMLQETELPQLGALAQDIIFHGAVSLQEIPKVYAKAAVCVFPSHMETLGLVAPEAMAMEKAVVFTTLGPGSEVIEDGITGYLCNPHNAKDIAEKILLLLQNPEKATALGVKARQAVLQKFEINTIVNENIAFYTKISKK